MECSVEHDNVKRYMLNRPLVTIIPVHYHWKNFIALILHALQSSDSKKLPSYGFCDSTHAALKYSNRLQLLSNWEIDLWIRIRIHIYVFYEEYNRDTRNKNDVCYIFFHSFCFEPITWTDIIKNDLCMLSLAYRCNEILWYRINKSPFERVRSTKWWCHERRYENKAT